MGVVGELGEFVVVVGELALAVPILVRLEQCRRPGPDGSVEEEIAADRLKASPNDVRHVSLGDVHDHLDGKLASHRHQHLVIPATPLIRYGHLVHAGHSPLRREVSGSKVCVTDLQVGKRFEVPPLHVRVCFPTKEPRRLAPAVAFNTLELEGPG
jgi:hypothetical protein